MISVNNVVYPTSIAAIIELSKNAIDNHTKWKCSGRKVNGDILIYADFICSNPGCSANCKVIRCPNQYGYCIVGSMAHTPHEEEDGGPISDHLNLIVVQNLCRGLSGKKLFSAVSNDLGCKIPDYKIRYSVKKYQQLNTKDFTTQWQMVESMVENLNNSGFPAKFSKNFKNEIETITVLTNYATTFCSKPGYTGIMMSDGTHINDCARGILIIIATLAGNGKLLPIGFTYAQSEDLVAYNSLFQLLTENYITISLMLSDQSPALLSALNSNFENAKSIPCAWHLGKSLGVARQDFFELLNLRKKSDFENKIGQFIEKFPKASQKVLNFFEQTEYFSHPHNTLGMIADSPIESINAKLLQARSEEPIDLFQSLLKFSLDTRSKFINSMKENNSELTEFAENILKSRKSKIEFLSIHKQTNFESDSKFNVIEIDANGYPKTFIVDSSVPSCDCLAQQRTGLPCEHMIKVLTQMSLDIKRDIPKFFLSSALLQSLGEHIDFHLDDEIFQKLTINESLQIPEKKKKPGRQKIRRIRHPNEGGNVDKRVQHCRICGDRFHNMLSHTASEREAYYNKVKQKKKSKKTI